MKKSHYPPAIAALVVAGLFAGTVVVGVKFAFHGEPVAAASQVASQGFTFDSSAAPSWRHGPSNATSLALFDDVDDCTVMIDRQAGTVDAGDAATETTTSLQRTGYTINQAQQLTRTFRINDTSNSYTAYRYTVTGPSNVNSVYKGQEVGYATIPRGYIRMQAYCTDPAQLSTVDVALSATSFRY